MERQRDQRIETGVQGQLTGGMGKGLVQLGFGLSVRGAAGGEVTESQPLDRVDSPLSRGAHQLIKQGAKLVESVEDVMETLGYIGEQLREHATLAAGEAVERVEAPLFEPARLNLKGHEKTVYEALGKEPAHTDQLIAETNLPAGTVNASVVSLRLKGLIKQLPGNLFAKR